MRGLAIAAAMLALTSCGASPPSPQSFERLSADPVVHGERLAQVLGCTGCHGKDLTGRDWSDELGRLWTANLTRSAARHDDAAMLAMITTGRQVDTGRSLLGMPSHLFTQLDPGELRAVLAFIRSRPVSGVEHPGPTLSPQLRAMMAKGEIKTAVQEVAEEGALGGPIAGPGHARARYIARATCAECHGLNLEGGTPPGGGEPRPDIRMMAAAYSPAEFERLLTTGIAPGGRELGLMKEVALGRFVNLTPAERRALYAYLVALNERTAR